MSDLPQFLLDLLSSVPRAGDGVHLWLYRVARQLHAHRNEEDIFLLLKASAEGCGRPVEDGEVTDAIVNSRATAWRPANDGGPMLPVLKHRVEPELEPIDCIVRAGAGLVDVWEGSPIRFEGKTRYAEEIVDVVFPGDPLLCCGKSKEVFATRRRETWRGRLSELPLIVPSPMVAFKGRTQKGTLSEHTKEATARRVYQGIEFDFAEKCRDGVTDSAFAPLVRGWKADGIEVVDACAALILYLKEFLPTLVVVCFSGGKSIHAWFNVFNLDRAAQTQFMDLALWLGADPATRCKSQFVRIPDGKRECGVRQTAYYLDPQQAVYVS